jgi:hypothetical protein
MAMRWQIRSTLLISAIAPPATGILLQTLAYWPQWFRQTSEPNQILSFVVTGILFTIPLSYVFGLIPSAVAGGAYCGILTYIPSLRVHRWLRTIPAAMFGGVAGATIGYLFNANPAYYAVLCASVAVVLAAFIPSSDQRAF